MNKKENHFSDGVLIDVLSNTQYAKEHILGAENFCVYEISFLQKIQEAFPSKKERIFLYGYSDETEEVQRARYILESDGYTNVHILQGGLEKWREDGGEIEVMRETTSLNGVYNISLERSVIEWSGRNIGSKHRGSVGIESGSLSFDNDTLYKGELVVDMTRISNDDLESPYKEMLVSHLGSDDFFSVQKHPYAKIVLVKIEKNNNIESLPNYNITANLTIKDRTEEIFFSAFVHEKEGDVVWNAYFDIDRTRWNIKYGSERFFSKLGIHIIDDRISLECNCFFEKDNH